MKTKYHIEITRKALNGHFSSQALETVIHANIRQDRIKYMFGHDHLHFDSSAFTKGFEYISSQKSLISSGIEEGNHTLARQALGRLTHSWQDFYSHSNYVQLWIDRYGNQSPEKITHEDAQIMHHPELKSGEIYGVFEFIALLPGISKFIKPLMPENSHARMNLDSPASGDFFDYAYYAAVKQTRIVFDTIMLQLIRKNIKHSEITRFTGQITGEEKV